MARASDKFETQGVINLLAKLAAEPPERGQVTDGLDEFFNSDVAGLGHSQFNEVLLFLGYDRICLELFDFIATGRLNPGANSSISGMAELAAGVDRFRKLALFAFGNVKFGFKRFAQSPKELRDWTEFLTPISDKRYQQRTGQALRLKEIDSGDRYYLGYIVEQQMRSRLDKNPKDEVARRELSRREEIVKDGTHNQIAYLTSDYLDVYVATSMRERHEYLSVAKLTEQIFQDANLKQLNLRWFDPTLAYCASRIDKGLAEALMLKRARCTLFLAQESDTLGKDSELASTLAQGKPVIAYVPIGDRKFVDELLRTLTAIRPDQHVNRIVLEHLPYYAPKLAWEDEKVRKWLRSPEKAPVSELMEVFYAAVKKHYDSRAKTMKEHHPLGIQVHLSSGVAVGVLVVRTIDSCAKLIRRIMLGEYGFELQEESKDGVATHLTLREELSDSVFRVMTFDKTLTHTFWNFYLR